MMIAIACDGGMVGGSLWGVLAPRRWGLLLKGTVIERWGLVILVILILMWSTLSYKLSIEVFTITVIY